MVMTKKKTVAKRIHRETKAIKMPIINYNKTLLQASQDRFNILWGMCKVDPALAVQILATNIQNRGLCSSRVDKYAADMVRNKWKSEKNGDPIRINEFGNVCDGQHRLNAIIASDTVQYFVFAFNIDRDCFKSIDIGKTRNLADALRIMGYVQANELSSSLNLIQRWEMGDMFSNYSLTNDEGIELVGRRLDVMNSLKVVAKISGSNLLPKSSIAFLHYVFSKKNKKDANDFINKLIFGENLIIGNPIYVLRERLINSRNAAKAKQLSRLQKLAITVKAWNAYRKGRDRITLLTWQTTQDFPAIT